MSKSKDASIQKQILDYMIDQNRPFSANDIVNNILKDIGKVGVTRALDLLISEKKINEKTYGKQKVYFVDQSVFSDIKDVDVQKIDSEINELTCMVNGLNKQIKITEDMIEDANKTLTTEKAEIDLNASRSEIPILKDKLNCLELKSGNLDPEEIKQLYEKKKQYVKEYKRRKRMADAIIDAILEDYPKNKKQLLEEIGIELDDNLKVK